MKIELCRGENSEAIPCPENAFMAGLKLLQGHGYFNICNDIEYMKSLLGADGCETVERRFEDGTKLQLAIYTYTPSVDPKICSIVEKYEGLELLELQLGDIAITVTL